MSIELNNENSIDLIKRYLDIGYTKTGCISIKEGAVIHRYLRILKRQEEDSSITDESIFKVLFKVLEVFNSNKAFTLDDVAVIDKVVTYIEENIIKPVNSNGATEKIREF